MEPNTARDVPSTQRTFRRVAGTTAETDLRPGVSVEHGEQESKERAEPWERLTTRDPGV